MLRTKVPVELIKSDPRFAVIQVVDRVLYGSDVIFVGLGNGMLKAPFV